MVHACSGPHKVQELEDERKDLSWEKAGTCSSEQKGQGGNSSENGGGGTKDG